MKVILQRCLDASVTVNNKCVGKIDKGYSQIICDVMDRTVAFASPNSLIVNYVYTFSIITPLY